mmetsp:Transcript_95592/g.309691  ORF Transcript_95592/g.309691 Transcript_95592/m.309691 type:complete len:109 (-) Transcript_95592:12-338(-)
MATSTTWTMAVTKITTNTDIEAETAAKVTTATMTGATARANSDRRSIAFWQCWWHSKLQPTPEARHSQRLLQLLLFCPCCRCTRLSSMVLTRASSALVCDRREQKALA